MNIAGRAHTGRTVRKADQGSQGKKGLKQDELARKARVSRTIVSLLERGKAKAMQSDTLDRLLMALELQPQIGQPAREGSRKLARVEQELKLCRQRERAERSRMDQSRFRQTAFLDDAGRQRASRALAEDAAASNRQA